MQANQPILHIIQRQLKWYGHLLRTDDNLRRRRCTSGHRAVADEIDRNNHKNQVMEFVGIRNIEEPMT